MNSSTIEIKNKLQGKRLLILGGSLWKEAIKKIADTYKITLIATGNDQSAGIFEIADEKYSVNSIDSAAMKSLIKDKKIDGVYMGGSETVISYACQYLNDIGKPCYCTKKQWDDLQNKTFFKELCIKHGLPVAGRFNSAEDVKEEDYPVIVKPADGSGSNGFSVCQNPIELEHGIEKAKINSPTQNYIIEKFVKNEGVVVFYTVSNGRLYFSGLEDKYPVRYKKQGSYVGGLFVFESKFSNEFRKQFESKINSLINDIGIKEGTFWIEVFKDQDSYYFNECGFRYGGSASIYPVDYMHGINQVASDIYFALTGEGRVDGFISIIPRNIPKKKYYAVYPIYSKPGVISEIEGQDILRDDNNIVYFPTIYKTGREIDDTGSFSQVVALAHFVFNDKNDLKHIVNNVHSAFHMYDTNGDEMTYRMLYIDKLKLKG